MGWEGMGLYKIGLLESKNGGRTIVAFSHGPFGHSKSRSYGKMIRPRKNILYSAT